MFADSKTKCSDLGENSKTKRTSVNLFALSVNPTKKHRRSKFFRRFFVACLLGSLATLPLSLQQ